MRALRTFLAPLLLLALIDAHSASDPHYLPVKAVGNYAFAVHAPDGSGVARYFGTGSLDGSRNVTRVIINIPGLLRNGDVYERVGEKTLAAAHATRQTLLITPQFLAQVDVTGHRLPADTLRWQVLTWLDGLPAVGPAPVSVFSVLDAMLDRLADRSRFPALREIDLIGHSAGGQVVHRYAVVGSAPDRMAASGIRVRFVVANPSSYVYFNDERPAENGTFAPYDTTICGKYNHWKYGFEDPPPYVDNAAVFYEKRYMMRDVTYLLGQEDIDPRHPELDRRCQAEAEGRSRFLRGVAYVRYLKQRHSTPTRQSLAEVPRAAHDPAEMFASACGVAVIFERPRTACKGNERI